MLTPTSIVVACVLAGAACSSPERAPTVTPVPIPAPVPAPAPRDPMAEASLDADLRWLADPLREGRGSRTKAAQDTAKWLVAELAAAGYAPMLQPITDAAGQSNVIVERGGEGKAVIVVAHYDHLGVIGGQIHPGADDNASGVAVALAVARSLAREPLAGRVVFVFTGAEEQGLLGARTYVAAPTVPFDRVRAVFNLDMVGRNFFASTANEEAKLAAVGLAEDEAIAELAKTAAAGAGLELYPVGTALIKLAREDHRSDDWVFRDRGVFAVHFSTGLNEDYHQPTDTLDKVSRPQLVRMAKFMRALVVATAK